jgi:TetR/AcrR family transcriptional repressor of mexJK operon
VCFGRLAEVLARGGRRRGEVEVDDPNLAAQDLCGLWKGAADIGLRLGLEPLPSPQAIRARVERATRLFLKMVGSKP